MATQELLGYLTCPAHNNGRWRFFYATDDASLREYMLTLILRDATNNEERWKVCGTTNDASTREEALEHIARHAEVIDELWRVYFHTQSYDLCTRILILIEFACKVALGHINTTVALWALLVRASSVHVHTMILSKILDITTSDGERWEVFLRTEDPVLKKRALRDMGLIKNVN